MAGAARLVSVDKGHDPREFALFAFGGAGPMHATAIARELGVPHVLVPRYPGITSALGCVLADVRHDFVRTLHQPLEDVDAAEADRILADQAAAGRALLAEEGGTVTAVDVVHEADLFYRGQSHVFRVPVSDGGFDAAAVRDAFADLYRERFDIVLPEMQPILVNLRTTVRGIRPAARPHARERGRRGGAGHGADRDPAGPFRRRPGGNARLPAGRPARRRRDPGPRHRPASSTPRSWWSPAPRPAPTPSATSC